MYRWWQIYVDRTGVLGVPSTYCGIFRPLLPTSVSTSTACTDMAKASSVYVSLSSNERKKSKKKSPAPRKRDESTLHDKNKIFMAWVCCASYTDWKVGSSVD